MYNINFLFCSQFLKHNKSYDIYSLNDHGVECFRTSMKIVYTYRIGSFSSGMDFIIIYDFRFVVTYTLQRYILFTLSMLRPSASPELDFRFRIIHLYMYVYKSTFSLPDDKIALCNIHNTTPFP